MTLGRKEDGSPSAERSENQPASGPQVEHCKRNSLIFQFDQFTPLVEEPKSLVKKNCDLFEEVGEYDFQNA